MALNSNALTDLATVKDDLGISKTDYDSILERMINAASQSIEKYLDRVVKEATYTEFQDGRASNKILLKEYPVSSITSLHIDNDGDFDANALIDSGDYSIDSESMLLLRHRTFTKGYQNIKVVYVAGYSTVPSDIEHACIEYVNYLYVRRSDRRVGVKSKSKGGENITFVEGIPELIAQMLLPYKRNEFPSSNSPVLNL